MFRIRKEQFEVFSDQQMNPFVERMVERLKSDFSEDVANQKLEEEDLEPLVRQGIQDAEQYGVIGELDLELYIDCLVLFSPTFDRDPQFPWAGNIFRNDSLSGTEKMNQIHDYLIFSTDKGR